jgi:hypothetical protein
LLRLLEKWLEDKWEWRGDVMGLEWTEGLCTARSRCE